MQPAQFTVGPQELDLVYLVSRDVLALADVVRAAEAHDDRDLGDPLGVSRTIGCSSQRAMTSGSLATCA